MGGNWGRRMGGRGRFAARGGGDIVSFFGACGGRE